MSEMEEKLGAILNNPQMMQQIMSMAQAMGAAQTQQEVSAEQKAPEPDPPKMPQIDPGMLKNLAGIAKQNGVDRNQQALLRALSPYLSRSRISKLERAMRAAKMAGVASNFLGSGGLQTLMGR